MSNPNISDLWRTQIKTCLERLNTQDMDELSIKDMRALAVRLNDLCEQFCTPSLQPTQSSAKQ
jgi:hypothetical protein